MLCCYLYRRTVADSGNLAVGRLVVASSTCGLEGPQEYCILSALGGNRECFTCDGSDPATAHDADALSDRDSRTLSNRTWWQSENGVDVVALELNLEALFYFTHLVLTFRSPRPAAAIVETSRDFGATYQVRQYYSNDCEGDFGLPDRSSAGNISEVICTSQYSNRMPLSNGEVKYIYLLWSPTIYLQTVVLQLHLFIVSYFFYCFDAQLPVDFRLRPSEWMCTLYYAVMFPAGYTGL